MAVVLPSGTQSSAPQIEYPHYLLTSDGVNVSAYDHSGHVAASGADGGAVLAAILPVAGAAGASIVFRNDGNVFPWGSVPGLPGGITRKLLIVGNGSTVKLSAGGPRFLDFAKVADGDTFQNIAITDFIVDANGVTGKQHIIIGTRIAGANISNLNFNHLELRRIRAVNLVNDQTAATDDLRGVDLTSLVSVGATVITDILIEDVRVEGGNAGFHITGQAAGTTAACTLDRIILSRCWHSTGAVPTRLYTSENIQIGGKGTGGSCAITDCYGQYSGDTGIEIDGMTTTIVERCIIEDAWSEEFYQTNIQAPLNPDVQLTTFRNCSARVTAVAPGNGGYAAQNTNAVALGALAFDCCSYYQNFNGIPTAAVFALNLQAQFASARITGCRWVVEGIAYNSGANTFPRMVKITPATTQATVTIVDCSSYLAGSLLGAGLFDYTDIRIGGLCEFTIDRCSWNDTMTNLTTSQTFGVTIGLDGGATCVGAVRRYRVQAGGDATTITGVQVKDQSGLTIPGYITIAECELAACTAANEIVVFSTNKPFVKARNNIWNTTPAPLGFTGLATATGKQIATVWPAIVTFKQATGTADTAIDYSTNGGTTYTNFLTQVSGALPAGFDASLGPLATDALIKVTFTGTQPTITLVPADP